MQKYLLRFTVPMLFLSLLFSSCEEVPVETKIYGTITLLNNDVWSDWKDKGVVELTIFPEFSLNPPAGWGEVPDGFFGEGVPGGLFPLGAPYNAQNPVVYEYDPSNNKLSYEIKLEPGTYSALALGFRSLTETDPTKKTATLGVHWDRPMEVSHGVVIKIPAGPQVITIFDYPAPSEITISEGEQMEINFTADFDFVNEWFQ